MVMDDACHCSILGYSYIIVANGPINPIGRTAFVKLANPDFFLAILRLVLHWNSIGCRKKGIICLDEYWDRSLEHSSYNSSIFKVLTFNHHIN
jgi:hypothetical protein